MITKMGQIENNTTFYLYLTYGMPQSLIAFAVSRTLETPNFRTFGGVAHPL